MDRQNRSTSATWARDEETKKTKNETLHQFSGKRGTAQTTHVVRSHPNTVWHGGCSSSSSCQFQVSSTSAEQLPRAVRVEIGLILADFIT